jgi:exopolysaccharide biosynthesis polyprenyl glycosylphosphotransferase
MAGRHSHIAFSVSTREHGSTRPAAPLRPLTGIPDPPELPPGSDSRLAHHLLEGRGWIPLRVAVDLLAGVLAVVAAVSGAAAAGVESDVPASLYALPVLLVLALAVRGMYRTRLQVVILDGVAPVVGAVSISAMIVVTATLLFGGASDIGPVVARAWVFALLFVGGGRIALGATQRVARRRREVGKATLIVGAGIVGTQVAARLNAKPEYGLRPVGFLDAEPSPDVERHSLHVPILGGPDDLERVAAVTGAKHVILAFSAAPDRVLIPVARQCEALGLDVSLVPRLFESINERVAVERLGGLPLLGLRSVDPAGPLFMLKYVLDRVLAALAILVLSPLLLIVALSVRLSSPGPVLFRQLRVGRDGAVFHLLKFRSMRVNDADEEDEGFRPAPGSAPGGVEGNDRRTPVGRLIRRTSLDELPQLFNVLRGDMSLVGPRPERPEFVELFRQDVARYGDRHRVKSGITGWAQVHGFRGQTSLADRVEWDNYYIENWSPGLDLKILLMTFAELLRLSDDAA